MEAAIYIETAGCAFNVADGEAMAGQLARAGYRIEPTPDVADLVILNTCTVKNRTFLNFRKRLDGLRARTQCVVVAGCIPPAYASSGLLDSVSTLDPDSVDRVGEVVRDTLAGRVVHARSREPLRSRPTLPTLRRNPVVEILPIARGCLSACAFCQTRISRGRLASFSAADILERVRRAVDDGVRELWVTGQDTGVWGLDIGSSLPELLEQLLRIPGDFRVRLGMTSPQWVTPRTDAFLDCFSHPKMFRFFHVPIQSGSDAVLGAMKREGSVAEFEAIHAAFIDRFPDGSFVTDLIAAFPTETEADFEATLALVESLGLPGINVSRFSARPGTSAAMLPPLPSAVVSERTKTLVRRVREVAGEYHRRRVGQRCRVLIDRHDAQGRALGRTDAYRPVLIDRRLALGECVEVEIVRGENFSFRGELITERRA